MKAIAVSTTYAYGQQRWRQNEDGSWDALAFGSQMGNKTGGLSWFWIPAEENNVPSEVLQQARK